MATTASAKRQDAALHYEPTKAKCPSSEWFHVSDYRRLVMKRQLLGTLFLIAAAALPLRLSAQDVRLIGVIPVPVLADDA
jgi:hypothetical protein